MAVERFFGQIGPELGALGRNLHPGLHRAPAQGIEGLRSLQRERESARACSSTDLAPGR